MQQTFEQKHHCQLSLEFIHNESQATQDSGPHSRDPFERLHGHLDLSATHNDSEFPPVAETTTEPKPKAQRTSPEEELAYLLSEDFFDPLAEYDGPKVQLFDKKDVLAAIETTEAGDLESQSRNFRIIKKLIVHGRFRKLRQIDENFFFSLRALQDQFEQFGEVIQYIVRAAMLAKRRGDNVLRMTPILLIGEAGTGKTDFATSLSKILRTAFKKIDMASAQNNYDLAGSSSFYVNSSPGKILLLSMQEHEGECTGNPLVLLDELDKGCGTGGIAGSDPSAPLLSLLERHTATRFVDLCIDIPVDVSNYNFIATCNWPELISAPIRSRFREFQISLCDEVKKRIAIRITHQLSDELDTRDLVFHPSAIDALAALASPRLVKQHAADAIGSALLANRDIITAADIKLPKQPRRKIGFL
ncbi:AAA family ATPase [Duganella vulcania]|uniref:AAA family ATPase n=1 Tax=Duganella vulcania TaxID=2692166 RepID=A0A845GNE5_9BURK|nr:AAA family ATPase [Duganella vulcania]MYM96073.1 AAA family ATPase [Duganella vulcania]